MGSENSRRIDVLRGWLPALTETTFGIVAMAVSAAWPNWGLLGARAPLAAQAMAELIGERISDGAHVLDEESVSDQDIADAIGRDAATSDVLREAANGVLTKRDRAQRRMLARSLASAVLDDAIVEPQLRYVRAVAQLTFQS